MADVDTTAKEAARIRGTANAMAWRAANKERYKAYQTAYLRENAERLKSTLIAWRLANPEKVKAQAKAARLRRRDKAKLERKEWRAKNPDYDKNRRKDDVHVLVLTRMRARLGMALKADSALKAATTIALVGCTARELVAHIEAQFVDGMSWERRSEIHIDHIRECATFDLTDPAQQAECFHFTNLRPLWAIDNQSRPRPSRRAPAK